MSVAVMCPRRAGPLPPPPRFVVGRWLPQPRQEGGACPCTRDPRPPLVGLRDELRDARQMCAWKRRFVVQFLWSGPSPAEPGSASARLWPCHCCRSASSGRTSWSPWCLRPVRKGAPGRAVVALMGPQGGKGVLILSDSLNHASIVEGVKQCGATVKPFAHNDMPDLQRMLHTATTKGQAAFAKEKASPRKRQEEPLSRLLPRPRPPPSSPGARSSLLSRASTAWRASSATCPRSWR